MDAIWGDREDGPMSGMERTYILRLRRKTKALGLRIETVWGVGYRLSEVA